MRVLSTSAMAVLMVAALFWGNCLSCPQLLVSHSAHACCHHHQQSTAKADCQSQALQHFVQADRTVPPMPAVAGLMPPTLELASFRNLSEPAPVPASTPPDILSLRI